MSIADKTQVVLSCETCGGYFQYLLAKNLGKRVIFVCSEACFDVIYAKPEKAKEPKP